MKNVNVVQPHSMIFLTNCSHFLKA